MFENVKNQCNYWFTISNIERLTCSIHTNLHGGTDGQLGRLVQQWSRNQFWFWGGEGEGQDVLEGTGQENF